MTREVERTWEAVQCALEGTPTVLVCGGDPGIYALAGLVFDLCRENNVRLGKGGLEIEVVPGVPALCAGAALLGAPLTHDFAAVSLSDLLTPWETIEKRLKAVAFADFVVVIYNPKSKKRDWQIEKAREILLSARSKDTPVGIVTGAMRETQKVILSTLGDFDASLVNMQTTVFVGNSATYVYDGKMVTPRGYGGKYELEEARMKDEG
jgi:precorrin-3B C17-methyltransferase